MWSIQLHEKFSGWEQISEQIWSLSYRYVDLNRDATLKRKVFFFFFKCLLFYHQFCFIIIAHVWECVVGKSRAGLAQLAKPTDPFSTCRGRWAGKMIRSLCVTARPGGAGRGVRCRRVYLLCLLLDSLFGSGSILLEGSSATSCPVLAPCSADTCSAAGRCSVPRFFFFSLSLF